MKTQDILSIYVCIAGLSEDKIYKALNILEKDEVLPIEREHVLLYGEAEAGAHYFCYIRKNGEDLLKYEERIKGKYFKKLINDAKAVFNLDFGANPKCRSAIQDLYKVTFSLSADKQGFFSVDVSLYVNNKMICKLATADRVAIS